MPHGGETAERHANPLEIVGAWLHVWVPPRDVEIPPVPWRKLALWTGVALALLAVALVILVPKITNTKDERAAQANAQHAAALAQNRARITRLQAPHHASAVALKGERTALLAKAEASITADAKARAVTGEIRPVSGPTTCKPTAGTPVGRPIGTFDCFTIITHVTPTARNVAGVAGYPFRAVVDFQHGSYTWCRMQPNPGERMIPDPRSVVQLPRPARPGAVASHTAARRRPRSARAAPREMSRRAAAATPAAARAAREAASRRDRGDAAELAAGSTR